METGATGAVAADVGRTPPAAPVKAAAEAWSHCRRVQPPPGCRSNRGWEQLLFFMSMPSIADLGLILQRGAVGGCWLYLLRFATSGVLAGTGGLTDKERSPGRWRGSRGASGGSEGGSGERETESV